MPILVSSPHRLNSLTTGTTPDCLRGEWPNCIVAWEITAMGCCGGASFPSWLNKRRRSSTWRKKSGRKIDALECNHRQQLCQRRQELRRGFNHLHDLLQTSLETINQEAKLDWFSVSLESKGAKVSSSIRTRSFVLGTNVAHRTTDMRHLVLCRSVHACKAQSSHPAVKVSSLEVSVLLCLWTAGGAWVPQSTMVRLTTPVRVERELHGRRE